MSASRNSDSEPSSLQHVTAPLPSESYFLRRAFESQIAGSEPGPGPALNNTANLLELEVVTNNFGEQILDFEFLVQCALLVTKLQECFQRCPI